MAKGRRTNLPSIAQSSRLVYSQEQRQYSLTLTSIISLPLLRVKIPTFAVDGRLLVGAFRHLNSSVCTKVCIRWFRTRASVYPYHNGWSTARRSSSFSPDSLPSSAAAISISTSTSTSTSSSRASDHIRDVLACMSPLYPLARGSHSPPHSLLQPWVLRALLRELPSSP